MNLNIYQQNFIICGAGSGLAKGVTNSLLEEGAQVFAITKTGSKLDELLKVFPNQLRVFEFDLTKIVALNDFFEEVKDVSFSGALLNSAGPPAITSMKTSLEDWDKAYHSLVRWKVFFTQKLLKQLVKSSYGRILFIESSAVKQAVENLILSTSMRLSIVGFAKTMAQEVAKHNITINILAPGFHDTPAVERVFQKKSEIENISFEQAKQELTNNIPLEKLGEAKDFGAIATFLLSPAASYITGQTISVDGGLTKFIFG